MIKRRAIIALLALTMVAVMSSGAIYAYFNDTETSSGNSFTAGTIDLTVDAQNPWASTEFTAENLVPGSTGFKTMLLTNAGSSPRDPDRATHEHQQRTRLHTGAGGAAGHRLG